MKTRTLKSVWATVIFAGCALASLVPATSQAVVPYTFTITGTAAGTPVSATALFEVSNGSIKLTLTNTTAAGNTLGPAQLLTGIDFTLANGATALNGATLGANTAIGINVDAAGDYTSIGSQTINWTMAGTAGGNYSLDFGSGADYSIIGQPDGDGDYSGANSGIKDNNAHNPFAFKSATYIITSASITEANTKPNNLVFYFGTGLEYRFTNVPEPATVGIFGLGLGLACAARRGRRSAKS